LPNKIHEAMLFLHYWQCLRAGQNGFAGRSLETPLLEHGVPTAFTAHH